MNSKNARAVAGYHESPPHWIAKNVDRTQDAERPKNALGRDLIDAGAGVHPLNTEWIKSRVKETDLSGELTHTTLRDIALAIVRVKKKASDREICLTSRDIEAAFPRLRIQPEDVAKVAVCLSEEIAVFMLFCFFGWTGFPMAWAVVSRLLTAVCGDLVAGEVLWYVDDSLLTLGLCCGESGRTLSSEE